MVSRRFDNPGGGLNTEGAYALQADGYTYCNGRSVSHAGKGLNSGDRVKLELDMGAKTLRFLRNFEQVQKMKILDNEVCLAACFGDSDQRVEILR